MKSIAIIGGGPIGMEAALYGACAGFDVHLYERGRLAENVRQWGHVRVFTEWKRNRSPLAVRLLAEKNIPLPPAEETSTGEELADYVLRLASFDVLRGRIHPQTEVAAIAREACLKSDFIDDPRRSERPFRLLLKGVGGEKLVHADAVIDATGVYASPNFAGSGGMPCPGEGPLRHRINYALPDVEGRDRARFANHHTLVVGSGHSAASTLLAIAALLEAAPQTRLTWAVRRDVPPHGLPYTLNPEDISAGRQKLNQAANLLVENPDVDFRPRTSIEKIEHTGARFRVTLREEPASQAAPADGATGDEPPVGRDAKNHVIECDNIAAHTGFRPDPALWRELQVSVHPATDGPANLSLALLESNRRAGVGLSTGYAEKRPRPEPEAQGEEPANDERKVDVRVASPDLLRLPEPDFYVLGIKSYGRDAGFLMQNGFRQVRDAYKLLAGDMALDLYESALD